MRSGSIAQEEEMKLKIDLKKKNTQFPFNTEDAELQEASQELDRRRLGSLEAWRKLGSLIDRRAELETH